MYIAREDAVVRLGYLALGTRLKRLGEQLQAGVAQVIAGCGFAVQAAQMPLLVAIDEGGGKLTVAQLVEAIGTSQPAISRSLGALEEAGLIAFQGDSADGRVRRPCLTSSGRTLLDRLRNELFPNVAAAAEALCADVALLADLSVIETRLRERTFATRIREQST
jgi:DNA-binding MarR family transcriptional regulator